MNLRIISKDFWEIESRSSYFKTDQEIIKIPTIDYLYNVKKSYCSYLIFSTDSTEIVEGCTIDRDDLPIKEFDDAALEERGRVVKYHHDFGEAKDEKVVDLTYWSCLPVVDSKKSFSYSLCHEIPLFFDLFHAFYTARKRILFGDEDEDDDDEDDEEEEDLSRLPRKRKKGESRNKKATKKKKFDFVDPTDADADDIEELVEKTMNMFDEKTFRKVTGKAFSLIHNDTKKKKFKTLWTYLFKYKEICSFLKEQFSRRTPPTFEKGVDLSFHRFSVDDSLWDDLPFGLYVIIYQITRKLYMFGLERVFLKERKSLDWKKKRIKEFDAALEERGRVVKYHHEFGEAKDEKVVDLTYVGSHSRGAISRKKTHKGERIIIDCNLYDVPKGHQNYLVMGETTEEVKIRLGESVLIFGMGGLGPKNGTCNFVYPNTQGRPLDRPNLKDVEVTDNSAYPNLSKILKLRPRSVIGVIRIYLLSQNWMNTSGVYSWRGKSIFS